MTGKDGKRKYVKFARAGVCVSQVVKCIVVLDVFESVFVCDVCDVLRKLVPT